MSARNHVSLIGRWTKDIELKTIANENQTQYFRNTLAVSNGKNKNGEELPSDFINVEAYGKNAENLAKFTGKGTKVAIEGELKTGSYKNQQDETVYTWGVRIDSFELVEPKKDGNQNQSAPAQNTRQNVQQNTQQNVQQSAPNDGFQSFDGIEDALPSGWGG